jgi:hypothetical protein
MLFHEYTSCGKKTNVLSTSGYPANNFAPCVTHQKNGANSTTSNYIMVLTIYTEYPLRYSSRTQHYVALIVRIVVEGSRLEILLTIVTFVSEGRCYSTTLLCKSADDPLIERPGGQLSVFILFRFLEFMIIQTSFAFRMHFFSSHSHGYRPLRCIQDSSVGVLPI